MKNPQAFPQFSFTIDGHLHEPGMTLRDHFAGLAMQSLVQAGYQSFEIPHTAYAWADAMLAEREK